MAISKGLKIGLSVAAVGITGTIVYMLIKKFMKGKKLEEKEELSIVSVDTPTASSPTPISSGSIPFTSKVEGNAFRGWINDTYPSYASEINLDRTGSYNNSYINKAWTKYGNVYQVSGGVIAANLQTEGKVNTASVFTNAYNVLTGTTGQTAPTGTFNAETSANALYNSMKGAFTDEDLFFNTSNNMTSSQRVLTREYFDDNNIGKGETLCEWIEGDFAGGEENKALTLYGLPTGAGYFESNCNK